MPSPWGMPARPLRARTPENDEVTPDASDPAPVADGTPPAAGDIEHQPLNTPPQPDETKPDENQAEVDDPTPKEPVVYQEVVVRNLAKRKQGEDWPHFLGPTRDSKIEREGHPDHVAGGRAEDRLAAAARHQLRHRIGQPGAVLSIRPARGPGATDLPERRNGRGFVEVGVHDRLRRLLRLQQRPAMFAGGRRRSSLPPRCRGHVALPTRDRRRAALES